MPGASWALTVSLTNDPLTLAPATLAANSGMTLQCASRGSRPSNRAATRATGKMPAISSA
jgi:hypothetical protein